jgi:hypothetical protein
MAAGVDCMLSLNIPTHVLGKKRPRTRAGREREYRHRQHLVTAFINGVKRV